VGPTESAPPPPVVSVLVVSHNCVEALRRCLAAIEGSRQRKTIEILIVDNGSVDGSGQLDADFPRCTILRLPRHFGQTRASNIGIRTAKGEFVLFLDPDVEVFPETIASLAARLSAEPEAVAVCPLLLNPEGEPVSRHGPLPTPEALYRFWRVDQPIASVAADPGRESISVDYPGSGAMLVRRHFLLGMNYLDQRYAQHWWDADLFFRIRTASRTILLLTAIRATSHGGEGLWKAGDPAARATLSADCALGAAAFVGKHYGFFAGLMFRLRVLLAAFGQALWALVTFGEVGYSWSRLARIGRGQKVDGSQQAF